MKSNEAVKLIPVLKRPRREWVIPEIATREQRTAREADEARIRAFGEGTTSYGREIFRRMLGTAAKWLEEGRTRKEIIREVEDTLNEFPELRQEFGLLLARTLSEENPNVNEFLERPLWIWANLIFAYTLMNQKAEEALKELEASEA